MRSSTRPNRAACRCSPFAAECSSYNIATGALSRVEGHVAPRQTIAIAARERGQQLSLFRRPRLARALEGVGHGDGRGNQGDPALAPHHRHHVASGEEFAVRGRRPGAVSQRVRGRLMRALILAAGRGSRMGALGTSGPSAWSSSTAGRSWTASWPRCAPGARRHRHRARLSQGHAERSVLSYFDNERWSETNMVMSLAAPASGCVRVPSSSAMPISSIAAT